jgi:acetyltransferase-like isoleucine patch superfamily enzyme
MKKIFMNILFYCYRFHIRTLRSLIISLITRFDGGEFYSLTLRRIFKHYYGVDIGLYTHGGCFVVNQMHQQTTIGRYCSIARTARVLNADHPMEKKSTHAFFFNPVLKIVKKRGNKYNPLTIGNDVWLGHNCIIMPIVNKIGDGAIIGGGAIINRDVPPYAVMVGNPARIVRYRFSEEKIKELLDSKWWEKSIEELKENLDDFV